METRHVQQRGTRIVLKPFEAWAGEQGFSCSVGLRRRGRILLLHYRVNGPLGRLVIPQAAERAGFRQGLWRTTCMECFVCSKGSSAYTEWNLSPSGDWWVCAFVDCRAPAPLQPEGLCPRRIRTLRPGGGLIVQSVLPLRYAAAAAIAPALVLEHTSGAVSHWAIDHPFGRPDFHRTLCCAHIV